MRRAVFAHVAGARSWTLVAAFAVLLAGCQRNERAASAQCAPLAQNGCEFGVLCQVLVDNDAACFTEHVVRGRVLDADDHSALAGASVVARDSSGAAVSRVVNSDARGVYVLTVPIPRKHDGSLHKTRYTLSANAAGYRSVTSVVALPEHDSSEADISLLPLESSSGRSPWLGPVQDPPHDTLAAAPPVRSRPGG